jgi:hypothetical protein
LRQRLTTVGLELMGSHHAHGLHAPYWWLRCLVGPSNDTNRAVAAYHRLLVRDIVDHPRSTRIADRVLTPVIGKSLVLYLRKPGERSARSSSTALAPADGAAAPADRAAATPDGAAATSDGAAATSPDTEAA